MFLLLTYLFQSHPGPSVQAESKLVTAICPFRFFANFSREGFKRPFTASLKGFRGIFREFFIGQLLSFLFYPPHNVVCQRHRWLRARYAGLFRAHVALGDYVTEGQIYGSIADPYGEQAVRLESTLSGYVIGLNYMPVVNQGDALLHLAVPV